MFQQDLRASGMVIETKDPINKTTGAISELLYIYKVKFYL